MTAECQHKIYSVENITCFQISTLNFYRKPRMNRQVTLGKKSARFQ